MTSKIQPSGDRVLVKKIEDDNKTKTEEERIEEFKKTNPLVVAYNRDKKINNIL